MRKHVFIITLLVFGFMSAQAQFRYAFSSNSATYTPLTGTTSLNGSLVWDEENLSAPMPFNWALDSSIILHDFELALSFPGVLNDTNAVTDVSGLIIGDMDIADRGALSTSLPSMSPIRYTTTGTSPNRIFKMEIANGGFYNEFSYSTNNDSFYLQIWIYETSNIIEYRYGPSHVTYPGDYFYFSGGPLVGFVQHADFNSQATGNFYYLVNNTTAPGIDSASFPNFPSNALNNWPANGTVYRFTPTWKGCVLPQPGFSAGSPVNKTVQFTYSGTGSADSVRWNFGDGTTSTSLNPSHTYTTNGHYNVCVTAYNVCGNNVYCKPTALAVGPLNPNSAIRIYPNPSSSTIMIEGMNSGSSLVLQNSTGQCLLKVEISSGKQEINISSIPAGTYVLTLTSNDGSRIIQRVTKN